MAVHTITVEPTGQQFLCPDTKNVLVAMEYLGCDGIQVGCRNGGCGVCRVQVLAGTYTAKKMSKAHVDEADLADGVVLSCRIFPTSDLTVRVCPKPTVEPALHPTASAGNDG
jgi:ferredoxin